MAAPGWWADSAAGSHAGTFREGEAVFARVVAASAPALSRADATRIARDALSGMVGSAVVGLGPEPEAAVRARVVAVLRMALVPAHVERAEAACRLLAAGSVGVVPDTAYLTPLESPEATIERLRALWAHPLPRPSPA